MVLAQAVRKNRSIKLECRDQDQLQSRSKFNNSIITTQAVFKIIKLISHHPINKIIMPKALNSNKKMHHKQEVFLTLKTLNL
jgi:hypothetical protein